jgi:epoxyqueuosine reductase
MARELGFQQCGIAEARLLDDDARHLESWLNQERNGEMSYMENYFDKRIDPRLLVPGAKSVVSLLLNYYPEEQSLSEGSHKISKYAYGQDYHFVIKDKLKTFMKSIHEEIGEVSGRVFVDSAPVLDKAWARESGIGWMGKHSNLINREMGSFFFIAELILDLELELDTPIKDYCGDCTACIDACPTDAIYEPYKVDGSKCISYFTIELKSSIPTDVRGQFEDWVFGCDICQDVCPWNRFSKKHNEPLFNPKPELLNMSSSDWEEITEEVFDQLFESSAITRTKIEGLKRNIKFIKS